MTLEASRTYCADFCASHVMDDFRTFLNDSPGHVHPTMNARRARSANASQVAAFTAMPRPRMGRCISGPKV